MTAITIGDLAMICLASVLVALCMTLLAAELASIAQRRREDRRAARQFAELERLRPLPALTVGEPAPKRRARTKTAKGNGVEVEATPS